MTLRSWFVHEVVLSSQVLDRPTTAHYLDFVEGTIAIPILQAIERGFVALAVFLLPAAKLKVAL